MIASPESPLNERLGSSTHFSGNRVNQDLATISEWPTNCTHTFIRSQSENAKLSH